MRFTQDKVLVAAVILILGVAVGAGTVLTIQHVRVSIHESLIRANASELWNAYRMWVEAGRPSGPALTAFAEKFKEWEWTLTEREISVDGKIYKTLFCDPDLDGYRDGILFVTTEGTVLW